MNLASPASNGIDAEVTLGQKKEEVVTEVGNTENKQTAEEIVNYVDNIPPLVLVFLVLGWLLPSPSQIWKGFLDLFRLRRTP